MPNESPQNSDSDSDADNGLLDPSEHENAVEHPTHDDSEVEDQTENTPAPKDHPEHTKPQHWQQKLRQAFQRWWDNKKLRYATLASVSTVVLLVGAIPVSRYFVLNTVGVRSKASIVVMDDSSDRPLKNVEVSLGALSAKTDAKGIATFRRVRLGRQKVTITKRAFAPTSKTITIGWGSNPLGKVAIRPVGTQYSFQATDFLSGKAVAGAEASSGEYDATADENGKIVLTVDAEAADNLHVTIRAKNYRDESVKLDEANKNPVAVTLVPRRKEVFISKRSGKYDLYKIDIDGKNEQLILAGTGRENENMALASHPTAEVVAFVSTRDTLRNKDGYLLSTLSIIDVEDGSPETVAQSEEIRLLGWSGDRLVFIQVAAGASAGNAKRQRLMSYDYKTNQKTELAGSNNFNDAVLIDSMVYFAPGTLYNSNATNHLYAQRVDGTNKIELTDTEIWNIFRTDYKELTLSADQGWFTYQLGDKKATRRTTAPTSIQDVQFISNADATASLWVEERDGKNTLILRRLASEKDTVLKAQAGLTTPIRWLDANTIIYRIQTPSESADYALSIQGGEARKIRDVTRSYGLWQ